MTTPSPRTDKELADLVRDDDEYAFTVLYERYHGYLYHFALKFLKSPEMAEEVVHDVFLKLWESRKTLDSSLSLKGYLIRICKNHTLNLMARALREQGWKKEAAFAAQAGPLHSVTEDTVVLTDYERLAEEAIALLPDQRRKIFLMYRFDHLSLDEIAGALGISKGTVKDHLLKATRQVKDYMFHHGIPLQLCLLILLR